MQLFIAFVLFLGAPLVGPAAVAVDKSAIVSIPLAEAGDSVSWIVEPGRDAGVNWISGANDQERYVILLDLPQGAYVVSFASFDKKIHATHRISVGGGPAPEPEPEPGPGPTPDPTPDPTPAPAPIPDEGLRVLIVYESGEMTKYPIETQIILAGADVREFLKKNCVSEGNAPGFRIYDPDIDLSNDKPVWQKAMARPRSQLPWLIVSNGKTGYEGPLPPGPTAFLELVKKYLPAGVRQ